MEDAYDCIIVGGGAAGLSAALVLGRARRRTLVLDAGAQSNLPAHGIGGLLGHDRRPPAELYARAHSELAAYPTVEITRAEVAAVAPDGGERPGFTVTLMGGSVMGGARILLAGGMDYRFPDITGLAERWGQGVFHCPFCHGWEVHGRPLGVLGGGAIGTHQARMLTQWSEDVTLLSNGDALDDSDRAALQAAGVDVDERPVSRVSGPGGEVEAVHFSDGDQLALGGLMVRTSLHQRSPLAADLGVAFAEPSPMSPDAIRVDAMYATSVAGVLAAGDVLGRPPSVSAAIADGNMAAAMIVAQLAGVM